MISYGIFKTKFEIFWWASKFTNRCAPVSRYFGIKAIEVTEDRIKKVSKTTAQ